LEQYADLISAENAAERFLRYVRVDTQSDPSATTFPSTEKQKDLGRILARELLELGIADAHLDEHGYVYATIPANTDKKVPVICFCSHMDTSPDCSGTDVRPVIHTNYPGGDIVLPADPSVVIRPADHPDLADQIGHDIITADGRTLLGADDKAGLAEIMEAARILMAHPEIRHGEIKILFTPDEEIGRGVDHVDLKKLGADFAYTIDGERAGTIEDETFSADGVRIFVRGVSVHPGFATGRMVSALKVASEIVRALPKDRLSPETTEGRQGFIHPTGMGGGVDSAEIDFIIRDHVTANLARHEEELRSIVADAVRQYPGSSFDFVVTEQYRNMNAGGGNRHGSDKKSGIAGGTAEHPGRHGRLAAVVHGASLPERLHRRACLPRKDGMDQPPGHGKGGADHFAHRQHLGGKELTV